MNIGTSRGKATTALIFTVVAAVCSTTSSSAATTEQISLSALRARLQAQREKIASLQIRVRRKTSRSGDVDANRVWPGMPSRQGVDETISGFKGNKRYYRVLELDYGFRPKLGGLDHIDESFAWTGQALLLRDRLGTIDDPAKPNHGKYEHSKVEGDDAKRRLSARLRQANAYLRNIGWHLTDPAKKAGDAEGPIAALIDDSFSITDRTCEIDGATCILLDGQIAEGTKQRLWLDVDHGFALRQWEVSTEGSTRRTTNREFVEIAPDVWFPKQSRVECFGPAGADSSKPLAVCEMTLMFWIANQVPDDVFDVALTALVKNPAPLDVSPAYHFKDSGRRDVEIWAVRGVGRRVEIRFADRLFKVTIDTPRWHFVWKPRRNHVTISPSRLHDSRVVTEVVHNWVETRANIVIWNDMNATAMFSVENENINGRRLSKLVAHCPKDPVWESNAHHFDPRGHLAMTEPDFRRRFCWFDDKNDLSVGNQCGCRKELGQKAVMEYLAADSISPDLFTFTIPEEAEVEISDPELGDRVLYFKPLNEAP